MNHALHHVNSEYEILISCRSIILPCWNIKDSFLRSRAFAIRKIAIQVSFNSSDLQTSNVPFYAQANSVSCFILDGDLFVFKSAWPFLKKFRPFYILYSLYCWICLGYLSYCVLILTCGFRWTPQENRSFIETCLLKTWNVSPLEIFFISFTDNTTLL